MRVSLIAIFTLTSAVCFSQAKTYTQAIINTTTNVIAPEEEDVQDMGRGQDGGGRGGMNFRNMMDGETKFVTTLKNDNVKTAIRSEMGKSTIYRDNNKKLTTTIMQMMGNETGFFVTDEEQVEMQKRRDSMMAERRKKDTSTRQNNNFDREKSAPQTEIVYTTETKKIAGFLCKKGYLITTRFLGMKDTANIWVTPDFKLQNILSTGSITGMPGMGNMNGLNGLDKIDGFLMRYEMKMRRGRRMEVEVTKVDLDAKIDDKEFEVPNDVEIKPMREMQNMFGGNGMQRGGRD
jgi:hypothetical protein